MTDRTGQHLGNYCLVQLLGQGGFAEVYLGEHIHLGTQAAIKLLHTQLAGEETDAFRKEARTIARLVHPHKASEIRPCYRALYGYSRDRRRAGIGRSHQQHDVSASQRDSIGGKAMRARL